MGTYGPTAGAAACAPCPAGSYCAEEGLGAVSGQTDGGVYCLANATSPDDPDVCTPCVRGHFCPWGSSFPSPCQAGTHAGAVGAAECDPCPAGFYCASSTSNASHYPCPQGSYCPSGTRYGTEFRCPAGTMSTVPGLVSEDECAPCPAGFYCAGT